MRLSDYLPEVPKLAQTMINMNELPRQSRTRAGCSEKARVTAY